MIIVIDGYNVIKQAMLKRTISEDERKSFIRQLGKYHKIKGHKIVLVFDGGPFERASKERIHGVYVIYAGSQETADDYIKRYLREHKALDILLVSSDRDICACALRLSIENMDALEFHSLFQDALRANVKQGDVKNKQAIKLSQEENPELDALMQKSTKVIQYKTEDMAGLSGLRASKAHKLSKKERKKRKKIKKL